jgi:release factor glutamine methyltransferase
MAEGKVRSDWPANNTEPVVKAWLVESIRSVSENEREAVSIADWLVEEVTQLSRGERLMHNPFRFSESALNRLSGYLVKLQRGTPIQQVLGYTEFCGLRFMVTPAVLIPRPETEELVAWIVESVSILSPSPSPSFALLDIGTGSGCIACSLAHTLPECRVSAQDISPEALEIARENAKQLRVSVHFAIEDNLNPSLDVSQGEAFDIVVSNPPYIPEAEMSTLSPRVRVHEPELALRVPDADPLIHYKAIVARCEGGLLKPKGRLFFECHTDFVEQVADILRNSGGWQEIECRFDLQGLPRMLSAVKR